LEDNLIKEIVLYAKEKEKEYNKNISFDMTTNGTLINEEMLKFFYHNKIKFLLSIDGNEEDHNRHRKTKNGVGSFDMVYSKISLFKRYQPWLGSRYTVYPDNVQNLERNVKYLFFSNINQFIIGPAHGIDWSMERINIFHEQLIMLFNFYIECRKEKRPLRLTIFEHGSLKEETNRYKNAWGCGAGRGRICLSTSGDIYGCSKLMSIMGVDKGILKMGNVFDGFNNANNRLLLNDNSDRYRLKCRSCDLSDRCTGGCPALNYSTFGNIYEPDPTECAFRRVYEEVGIYSRKQLEELNMISY